MNEAVLPARRWATAADVIRNLSALREAATETAWASFPWRRDMRAEPVVNGVVYRLHGPLIYPQSPLDANAEANITVVLDDGGPAVAVLGRMTGDWKLQGREVIAEPDDYAGNYVSEYKLPAHPARRVGRSRMRDKWLTLIGISLAVITIVVSVTVAIIHGT